MSNATFDWPQCQFKQFFPEWNDMLLGIMTKHCGDELGLYREDPHYAYELTGCLIENTPPYRQSEMSAVSIILGLTPTIIQYPGPVVVQTNLLNLHSLVLAFMVVLGLQERQW